jgi:predicted dehydrogenase
MDTTRWGILATGRIAASFARDLAHVPGAELAAVGSRSAASAEAFAREHGTASTRTHGSYDALLADDEVDVVYVASPHALHLEHACAALSAGRHVLCEKPLTLSLGEAERMVACAREHDRFLMEAMWMAFNPVVVAVREALDEGGLGVPRQLHADLGFVVDSPAGDRLVDPALGAGALLDMGIYPLTLAHLLLGPAEQLRAVADLAPEGYDRDIAVSSRHRGGALAALTASMTSCSPRAATLATSTGLLELPAPFHHPARATFTPADGGEPRRLEGTAPLLGSGLGNEAAEVQRCLGEGLRESPHVPHAQTLALMAAMDDLREQVGVRYPGES